MTEFGGETRFETLKNAGVLPLPQEISPYDPTILEAVKGLEEQVLAKSQEIIQKAGLARLPKGREGSGGLIAGPDANLLAYSTDDDIKFTIQSQIISKRDAFVAEHTDNKEFRVFCISVEQGGRHIITLELQNPVKTAAYAKLVKKGEHVGNYTAEDFARDELTDLGVKEIKAFIQKFLDSEPDRDTADQRAELLMREYPGIGTIVKLYTPSK